ncbi:MAG TPA: tetratricopeptide repeat protein, partial [Phycisphaerae bacterium]|nr:tetratricopeptide repeat protein [Phycisphaerae bacterium]
EELGDWQDSYTNLSRYLEDYPDDQRVLAPLAALARQEQQIPQAYLLFAWVGSQGKISSDIVSSNFLAMTGENPSAELISELSAARQAQTGSSGSGLLACWQLYLLGMAAGEGDQSVAAVGFLRQAVDADPNFWPARQLLVRHLEELNQFQEAENVIRYQKDISAAAEAELVRLYIAEDRLELAAQTAESGIKKYRGDSDCYFLAADIYDVQRDDERESYALARVVSRFPDLQDGYKRLLVFAADIQNEQLQNAVISRYIAQFPNDSFSGILSARLKAQQGDYSGAERILRQSLASHPGDESIYLALAGLQSAQGNQAATLEILQDAVVVDVDSVNLFTALAQTLESMKQPDEAVAIFAASASQHPDSESWQTAYASLLSDLGRNSEVESLIDKLRKQVPQQHWVQILYEQYLEQTGQWARAKQVLEQLCSGPYPQLTDLYDLAQVDLMLRDTASETSTYQRILKLSPYDADANNNLGYEWTLEDHNLQEAKRMISIAVGNYPNESAYRDSLGWVMFKLNEPRGALDELRTAVSLPGGQNPEGMEHLGDVLDALGEKSEAIESWKTGLQLLASQVQLSPDDLKTQKNLQDRIKKAAPWIKLDELKPENAM